MAGTLTKALVIMLCIDAVLFLAQAAMTDLNPGGASLGYNCQNSTLGGLGSCNDLTITQNPTNLLPESTTGVEPTTGNIFTDIFTSIKVWMIDKIPGVGIVLRILAGPMNILKAINLPAEFVYAVGTIWYVLTFFLMINWLFGRQGE